MAEIENSNFKFYKNKILFGTSEEDLEKIKQASNNFSIYYISKRKDKNLGLELEMNPIESLEFYLYINPYCRKDLFDGKLESIEQLIKPNLSFLKHRFTYTRTLKDFSELLKIGKFDCIEQYDEKDIYNYIKKKYQEESYNEKGNKYIGTAEAYSKLNYYPTSLELQYKLLPYLFSLSKKDNNLIKKQVVKFLNKYDLNTKTASYLYNELTKIGRFDLVDEVFKSNIPDIYSATSRLVIADLFAGEAEWLSLFKKYTTYSESYLVANEIEENRWKKCCEKKFQFKPTNLAYEELKSVIPEKFINVALFNPPYGINSEGKRNAIVFLESLIEDNYLADLANVAFVLNLEDFNSCKHLLAKYFDFNRNSVNILSPKDNESKLKQIIFVATKLCYSRKEGGYDYNCEIHKLNNVKVEEREVDLYDWGNKSYSPINISEKIDELKFKYNRELYVTDLNSPLWVNTLNNLTVDTFTGKKIKLPDIPDNFGIVANLISSGLINGEIEGEHKHSIAAGITERLEEEYDEETNSYIITKKQVPFCSVLSGMQVIDMTESNEEESIIDYDDEELAEAS